MPRDEFTERHVRTRRATGVNGDVIYGADFERRRFEGDPENPDWATEEHTTRAQAACGCLIGDDAKPRFHRNGVMVCATHYFFCSACSQELLPLDLLVVEKRAFCRGCGEKFIDRLLWSEFRRPGSIETVQLENLKLQKQELRSQRWSTAWNRLFGRGQRRLLR